MEDIKDDNNKADELIISDDTILISSVINNDNDNTQQNCNITLDDLSKILEKQIDNVVCNVCKFPATYTKRRNTRSALCCHECNMLVHFQCSKLPAYMLYQLNTTDKRYICEKCTATPGFFLQTLIGDDIRNIMTNVFNDAPETS